MKNERKLETKDIVMLANIHKMCDDTHCENCIFYHEEYGCLGSRVKDVIVKETGMARETLNRMIKTAVEASEDTDD